MLVYLPATVVDLRSLAAHGAVPLKSGWAVTDALRAVDPSLDEEDLEFHAAYSAADASAGQPEHDGRRMVVVADVGSLGALDIPEAGRVAICEPVGLDAVDAFLVDESDGETDDEALSWFARQELEQLL